VAAPKKIPEKEYSNLSTQLVHALFEARAKGLPLQVLYKAQLHIADALGIAVAARSTHIAVTISEALKQATAQSGLCQVFGGGSATALTAAFLNSSLIHILDYDDIHDEGRLHPGTVILPAVLAAADLVKAKDATIIEAMALGSELMCKLGVLCAPKGNGPGADWFLTQLFGYLGAAFAASFVLGLSEKQVISAIGLAYMQAAGGKEAGFGTGSNARAIYPAFAAQGGVQAALLAQAGMVGPSSALDGDAGFFKIYLGAPLTAAKRKQLLNFSTWHCLNVEIKPWPSCRLSHPYVAVGLAARSLCETLPDVKIRVSVNSSAGRLCSPLAERLKPATLQDAKYSIPFMTAFALVHGEPSLTSLSDRVLKDRAVLAMAGRIEIDQSLVDKPGHPMTVLTLMKGSKKIQSFAFKASDLSMSEKMIETKFKDCLTYAGAENIYKKVWSALIKGRIRQALKSCNV